MSPKNELNKRHRPGSLKQQNKPFKSGRHRSEHEIKRSSKGRTSNDRHGRSLKRLNLIKKFDKINHLVQIRKEKLNSNKDRQGPVGSINGPDKIITIIPLSSDLNAFSIVQSLVKSIEEETSNQTTSQCGAILYSSTKFRSKFCFLTPKMNNFENVLDTARISDIIVYVLSDSEGLSLEGDYLIDLINSYQINNSKFHLFWSNQFNEKTSNSTIKSFEKYFETKGEQIKFIGINNEQTRKRFMQKLIDHKISNECEKYICRRPFLFCQSFSHQIDKNEKKGNFIVEGYLRGFHLSANNPVYLPQLGTFQIEKIEQIQFQRSNDQSLVQIVNSTIYPDDQHQQSLNIEADRSDENIDNDQTWPTFEEIQLNSRLNKKKVPKGTSEYQSAWILSDDDQSIDQEIDDKNDSMMIDDDENEQFDEIIVNKNNYDDKIDIDEEKQSLEKVKASKVDEKFPDEVDTPMNIPARIRFQKYRGMKSFRTTKWDPKENLPNDYGRIFKLENFRSMVKQIQIEQQNEKKHFQEKNSVQLFNFVRIYIKDVPEHKFEPGNHLIMTGLLPYEQSLSILNIVLHRNDESETILKSKERLIFYLGFRRFSSCPIYSQHTNGDKHKFERYFRPGQTLVATCFGPITYPTAAVLAFKQHQDGREELIGKGSLLSVNPDRIVLKRIVLSGHPLKIHKRSSVVRYMFFNPEDVNWFKPIELRTRWGRRGHIKESLGTHGHMKCLFDGTIKSQDTIMMNLYKRVYPKWSYSSLTKDNQDEDLNDKTQME